MVWERGRLLHAITTFVLTLATSVLLPGPVRPAAASDTPRRPNVILILADDKG